jgi:poly-gamma-glutamate capsule biosynthesis protein CapA/YwtB (metallophosphatase superfamily)
MPVRFGALLVDAGYDVVSLANNHVDDFGARGRASTVAELDRLGVAHSGAAGTVARLVVRGRAVHVLAFAPYAGQNDMNDLAAARALVAAAAATGALVVVSFHGGAEGVAARNLRGDARETFWGEDRGAVRPFARAMVDAGADLVVGHGPHVLRALELYRGRLIAYSLGTFASYRGINVTGLLGVTTILQVTLAPDGAFASGKLHAVVQRPPGGPRLDSERRAVTILRELSRTDVGAAAPRIADVGT